MKRWRLLAAGAIGVGVTTVIACGPGFLDGISGGTRDEPDAADARVDAPPSEAGRACQPHKLPPPPSRSDSDLVIPVPLLAVETLRVDTFGADDAGGAIPIGLDLDDRCTCPEEESCVRAGDDAGRACDGKQGEDNRMSYFFNTLNGSGQLFEQTFATDRIRRGFGTIMVEVIGWNGTPNDTQVSVSLRLSQQLEGPKVDGGGFGPPRFDGTDVWTMDTIAVAGGITAIGADCRDPDEALRCLARTRDDNAYVSDGLLVAHPRYDKFADAPVPLIISAGLGRLRLEMFDLVVYGRLSAGADGGIARMDGELTGRVEVTNMLKTMGSLDDFTLDKPKTAICQNPALFTVARAQVCATPDLAPPGQDNRGARCDHISLAMSFSATPASMGTVTKTELTTNPCDESIYSCP